MNEQMKKYLDKMNEISNINIMDDDYEEKSKECARAVLDYVLGLVSIKEGVNTVGFPEVANAGAFIEQLSKMFFSALINLTYAYEENDKSGTILKMIKTIKEYEKIIFHTIQVIDEGYENLEKENKDAD